ncbi:MAG: hypothetical protein WC955_07320 [Elusimicrobiota bacterium]
MYKLIVLIVISIFILTGCSAVNRVVSPLGVMYEETTLMKEYQLNKDQSAGEIGTTSSSSHACCAN